ncbi:glycosyltransferase family 4 protein [Marivita sp. GX14005]|uniref:glycosyltransferase family 4 protein n=1 Tax=Marivita sp. GX14005 TaxID=2942276 RepID=UPI002019B4E7|nr:glycosyltransferase family 4 protein [Marivita sp. GX14005]MCL3882594.1 glycosyltransferase family 4 protein [Marivita sp. GX14005]
MIEGQGQHAKQPDSGANHPSACRVRIAIVDPCSASAYDLPSLGQGGLGGTEATILRMARALGSHCDITHFQGGRAQPGRSAAGRLMPLKDGLGVLGCDIAIVINRWKVALRLRKRNPSLPILLWLHVYPGRHNRKMGAALKAAGVPVICVSHTHARTLSAFLGRRDTPPLRVIYNPIDDDLAPDETPRDCNRLLFASSPHKGLAEVFAQFETLRSALPDLELAVADPGYLAWRTGAVPKGVRFLGELPHPDLIAEMRRSLCLFYPQTSFAETFGLVLAEANAVGIPALVHAGLGANSEILDDPKQCVNGHEPAQLLDRVREWRETPPRITGRDEFRLSRVAEKWLDMLCASVPARAREP